ncbi:Protein of unknown function [Pyronema omphalodes CBS 100304]|uniref:Uncharacterized protein n=1 Tax=Pyronema omphalodes (strain CBS 100304) TaxID=1076935 RepID=U4KWH2_PYROM|nr:Protein of unknown function [Pyronema omphalodes CBS 100304]
MLAAHTSSQYRFAAACQSRSGCHEGMRKRDLAVPTPAVIQIQLVSKDLGSLTHHLGTCGGGF